MREVSTEGLSELDPSWNLTDLLLRNVRERPTGTAFLRKVNDYHWTPITWEHFLVDVQKVARALLAKGLQPGDRVGLMSHTTYEWTLLDLAIMYAGGITVPIYETSSSKQAAWILEDSGIKMVFAEEEGFEDRLTQADEKLQQVEYIWVTSRGDLSALITQGTDVSDDQLETARSAAEMSDIATIVYTSGTTGKPKGCCLTHGNFGELAEGTRLLLSNFLADKTGKNPGTTLLFLPLAHVFARFVQFLCLANASPMGHTSDIKELTTDLSRVKPDFILSVPRVFEKVYNSAEQKARATGRGAVFTRAAKVAVEYSRSLDKPGKPPLGLTLQHKLFDRLVYSKLRTVFGGNLRLSVSGGGPLGERLAHFFRGAGVTILEGYGLTESAAPITVCYPGHLEIGTVGPPLPGCGVRIADDGEILLRGINIFSHYHNNPEATHSSRTDDGWFLSGDVGELTAAGHLKITGRKKEIIVTAGGKNVVPTILEDRMRMHPLISQALVVGDGRPFVAALIAIDAEMLPGWLKAEGYPELPVEEAIHDPNVQVAIQKAVDDANRLVSRAESVRKHRLLSVDFTVESGHLTPSMKMRRTEIHKDFSDEIDELYNS